MKKIIVIVISFFYAALMFASDGFLSNDELPDGLKILPPPPSMDKDAGGNWSPAFGEDQVISKTTFVNENFFNDDGTYTFLPIPESRKNQAKTDAITTVETFVNIFIDSSDLPASEKKSVKNILLNNSSLIMNVVLDAKHSTNTAKDHYQRERPFLFYNKPVCTGAPDPHHSYPSAHSTRGMVVAYTIADLLPSQYRAKILTRGMDYGDSRVICGAHWRSDIQAGRVMANAVYDSLKNNADFISEFNKVKDQLAYLI